MTTPQNRNTTKINSQVNTQMMSLKCGLYHLNLEDKQPYCSSKWSTLQASCIKSLLLLTSVIWKCKCLEVIRAKQ